MNDNLTILNLIEKGDLVRIDANILTVHKTHCNCNPDCWKLHFEASGYICEYEPRETGFNHTKRISEIFRRNGKNYIRFAHKKNGKLILDSEVE